MPKTGARPHPFHSGRMIQPTALIGVNLVTYAHPASSRIYQAWGIGRGMVGRRIQKLCCPCACLNAVNGYGWLSRVYMKLTRRKSPWKNKHSLAPDCLLLFRFSRMTEEQTQPLTQKEHLMIKITLLLPSQFRRGRVTLVCSKEYL